MDELDVSILIVSQSTRLTETLERTYISLKH